MADDTKREVSWFQVLMVIVLFLFFTPTIMVVTAYNTAIWNKKFCELGLVCSEELNEKARTLPDGILKSLE